MVASETVSDVFIIETCPDRLCCAIDTVETTANSIKYKVFIL